MDNNSLSITPSRGNKGPEEIANLSFAIRFENGTIDYWTEKRTQDDLSVEGRRRADELCDLITPESHNVILLPYIAQATAKREFGPMEIAFFHRIAEHLQECTL